MAKRKYSRGAQRKVGTVMREFKRGVLKSGRSGRKVKSRRQAVAIGLSEARRSGARVPSRSRSSSRTSRSRSSSTRSRSRARAR